MFSGSVEKALSTSVSSVCVNEFKYKIEDCERINEEYSAFVIPLANAFRDNYKGLDRLIPFIEKLKIPCVVDGVGA